MAKKFAFSLTNHVAEFLCRFARTNSPNEKLASRFAHATGQISMPCSVRQHDCNLIPSAMLPKVKAFLKPFGNDCRKSRYWFLFKKFHCTCCHFSRVGNAIRFHVLCCWHGNKIARATLAQTIQDAEKSRPGWEIPSQSLQITSLIFKFRKTIKQNLFYKCYSDIKNLWIKYYLQNRILLTNRLHSRQACAYLTWYKLKYSHVFLDV